MSWSGNFDQGDVERIWLRFRDLDLQSFEKWCEESRQRPAESVAITEAYILEQLDNVASAFLEHVRVFDDLKEYRLTLKRWVKEILPGLERRLLRQPPPEVRRLIEARRGRAVGKIDRGMLANALPTGIWKQRVVSNLSPTRVMIAQPRS